MDMIQAEDVMDSLLKEYLDLPTETESDIKGDVSDKNNDTITKECSCQPEEQKFNSSVPINVENVTADTECEELDNKGTSSSLGISSQTNGHSAIKKEENVVKQFKDAAIVDPPRSGLHPVAIKALRTHPHLRCIVYISCNPETLLENAIELCTPSTEKSDKRKGNKWGFKHMSNLGHARKRAKSMPMSEAFRPVKAVAVYLFLHTPHCEMDLAIDATTTVSVEIGNGLREVDIKKFVKIEKVLGGQCKDFKVLKGVMINKDVVAPGKMKRKILNPKIILLDFPLEYKKGENMTNAELRGLDAMLVARNMIKNPKLVPGGNAAELTVLATLKQKSSSVEVVEK